MIGIKIREARERSGITQETLAKMLNTKQSVISAIESGKGMPSVPRLIKIAIALEVSLDELVGL